ncbi:asparagine synthase-related protein [Ferdinandcohnia quinoae]|uniref:asparagine synthase (glutamine-hydrolyzing) n=1 Tax=Fredinandcohnia quinoae TaxID=2918902 RepID=A0AAW5E479_9BACI|nr:asparagine synthase-related protein [Fredinandcohnia sp. SECRCQ15]MCH1624882.1 asparagine synthase-related protein [Fredinandcohnia sp. SECRCQ15]
MSAITGIYNLNQEPVSIDHINGIMNSLQKYPANDIQVWNKENVFLGCHAQWITPESVGEQLPYFDHERQLTITADAIIDNRDELCELLNIPTPYRAEITDSELILLAYNRWGDQSPKFLLGDFAFMIWDARKRQFFGARDFSGTRTLYYYNDLQRFAFCTVIKSLLTLPYIKPDLHEGWIAEFLAIPVTVDALDTSTTVYKHINQIPPSHSIKITAESIKLSRYCTVIHGKKLKLKSNGEYEEAFQEVFNKAVKSRLRTYRQVGSHLSGGLDSGSVASYAVSELRKQKKQLYTYSYIPVENFVDWTHKTRVANEREYIQSTVDYVGNIKENYLDFEGKSPLSEVDDWLDTMEMPYKFYENSFWIKGIYEIANQHDVGILLNGQRGNWTVSWGHALDYYALLLKRLNWTKLYNEVQLFSKNMGVNKRRTMSFVLKKAFPVIRKIVSPNSDYKLPMLINPDFATKTNVFEKLRENGINPLGAPLGTVYQIREHQFEQPCYWNLNGTIGTKLSLRHAIWERDPTNDLRVIEFCLSVPEGQFVQKGIDRSLIRRATVNYLPDNIRLNMRKRGIQGADGLQRMLPLWNEFIDETEKLSSDSRVTEYLNKEEIKSSISKIRNEPKPEIVFDDSFRILMRSLIFSRFINKYA